MADKSFGVKELNLLNASGTPTVTSPNNLNLNANTVAISTSCTIGNNLTVTSTTNSANLNVTGIGTLTRGFATDLSVSGISTISQPSNANPHSLWDVVNNGSSAYRFTGPGQSGDENNPNIYLVRGQRYIFKVNASGHPFQLRVANGGAAYSDGVTNNGAQSGNVIINVQHDAPAQLYYQCTSHGGMVGNIYIVGGPQVISGVVTATTFVGNLTGNVTGTASANAVLTGSTNNQLVTVTGANAITGESNLTFDGSILTITGNTDINVGTGEADIYATGAGDKFPLRIFNSDTTSTNKIGIYFGPCNNVAGAYIKGVAEADFTSAANRDAGLELGTRLNATFLAPLKISADGTTTFDPNAGGTLKIGGSSAHTSKIVIADNAGSGNGNLLVEGGDGTDFFTIQSNGNVAFENGKGINFGATSDASGMTSELLDDYEEGSWTPAVQFDVGGSGVSYGTRAGTYVKIGRMVHLQYYMVISSGLSSSDYFCRLSLPFTGIGVGFQDARIRQWNTAHSDWFVSLGGAGPVFFHSNALGSGANYARGDDVNGHVLSGQYTLYVS